MIFNRISYMSLNARQKENYNFQKVSGALADFGFVTLRLSDDWNSADFIALHGNGKAYMVQLKSRLTFDKKYIGRNLWVCFRREDEWYFYPHDELLEILLADSNMAETSSWRSAGLYTFPHLSKRVLAHLKPYRLTDS